jgi:hypothetical protein
MLKLIALLAATLAALTGPAQADVSNAHYYSNQTLYGDPASTPTRTPPAGYELAFLENLGRHGARSLTSDVAEKRALAVWKAAVRKHALTSAGHRFNDDLAAFQKAERSIGYGELSAVGKSEWVGIGRRTAANYPGFISAAVAGGGIELRSSPVHRTQQSAAALGRGLGATIADADIKTDMSLVITNGASTTGNAAIRRAMGRSSARTAAKHILRRLYSSSYVNKLSDPVAKALDIYGLYSIAPSMQGETTVTFARYVPIADAKVMAAVKDAQNFYRYGPGVTGETSSFRQARPVLEDFFGQLDARIAGGRTAAVFRVGHGETTMPFAALIKAPGSESQVSKTKTYSWSSNPWRGHVAGRMSGNLEWAAYRNDAGRTLVTMRYNEQPVKFRSACKASTLDPYFYKVAELKSCLL